MFEKKPESFFFNKNETEISYFRYFLLITYIVHVVLLLFL